MTGLPFNHCENILTRKYTNLAPISKATLLKYMEKLTKKVENKIRTILPEKFTLIFDGWSLSMSFFFLLLIIIIIIIIITIIIIIIIIIINIIIIMIIS